MASVDPADIFFGAAEQFGLLVTVLLAQTVILALAVAKEWIVAGKTHRAILGREVARGDEWEKLFRDSVGLNMEQMETNKKTADIVELIAARVKKQTG